MKKIQILISRLVVGATTLLLALSMAPAAHAQFPGTNGRILWTTPLNGQYTIFPNGTNVNATGLPTITGITPSWQAIYTPSGQYIVHLNATSSGAASNVYVTNAARTITPTAITSFTTCNAGSPASNSTGTKIAFECTGAGPTTEIYVVDLGISGNTITGSNQIQLTNQIASGSSFDPVWAPDDSVLYIRNGNNILSISPTTPSQASGTTIFQVGSSFRLNDVNPAGSTLLYTLGSSSQLFTVTTAGASNTQITTDANATYFGGYFSPGGTQIVSEKSPITPSDQQIVTMTSAGASETVINSLNTNLIGVQNFRPFWSTDQQTYTTNDDGGTTPGAPNTTATSARKNSPVPWMLGGLLAIMLLGLGGYWVQKEIKGKK